MNEEIQWRNTHCARMDHGGCSLRVGVQGGRVVKIKGDPKGFLNRGYVCPKGLASGDRLTHPDRLTRPLKRVAGRGENRWAAVSWEEALDEIAFRLGRIKARDGARAVAFGLGMPKGLEHFVLIRLANLFGSPNVVASQDVCHAPREISGIHTCGFYPVADLHHPSKLIVLWGSNLTATNEEGEICRLLLDQSRAGTELMVIDPRRIPLAGKAREWLRIRPGTDLALALGFLHVILREKLFDAEFVARWTHGFEDLAVEVEGYPPERVAEITWVDAEDIRRGARLYARTKPAVIQWGNPIEHTVHAFQTARALICLMAVSGNLAVAGGNVQAMDPPIMGLGAFVRADRIPQKRREMISAHHGVIPRFMTIPPALFRRAVLEGDPYPVKGFYAMCCNPMLSYADSPMTYEALMRLEFLAVADVFMTPTAALADIVLPAATHFEFDDIGHYGLGHGYILARPKVVDPPPGCWPDIRILNELGKRLAPAGDWPAHEHQFLEDVLEPSGIDYAAFVEKGILKGPDRFEAYRQDGFRTPTGKVELRLSVAEKLGLPPVPCYEELPEGPREGFPLVLTSAKDPFFLHSSYRWVERLRKLRPHPRVEIHPDTAARGGIREGVPVRIETPFGAMTQTARLTDRLDPRVVCASHGWWFPEGDPLNQYDWRTANYNMLTSARRLGKEFGTPNLKGLPCRIRKAGGAGEA